MNEMAIQLSHNPPQVSDLAPDEVLTEIERIILQVASTILEGQGCEYVVPTRSSGNQQYIPELDRIVLKGKVSHRSFLSAGSVRKVVVVFWLCDRHLQPSVWTRPIGRCCVRWLHSSACCRA